MLFPKRHMCNFKLCILSKQGDVVETQPGVPGAVESPFNNQFMAPKADPVGCQI